MSVGDMFMGNVTKGETIPRIELHDSNALEYHMSRLDGYGKMSDGEPIVANKGWVMLAPGSAIPQVHMEYILGIGWAYPRRQHSTGTALWATCNGDVCGYAAHIDTLEAVYKKGEEYRVREDGSVYINKESSFGWRNYTRNSDGDIVNLYTGEILVRTSPSSVNQEGDG